MKRCHPSGELTRSSQFTPALQGESTREPLDFSRMPMWMAKDF
ncbi:MAG: hypothetical protein V1788_00265 [Nanoarchaeota archaeon]